MFGTRDALQAILALFPEFTMSDLHLEVLGIDRNYHADYRLKPSGKDHVADTVAITTSPVWQIAIPPEIFTAGVRAVIVTNLGPAPVRVAWSNEDAPAKYAVVLASAQRTFDLPSGRAAPAMRVRDI